MDFPIGSTDKRDVYNLLIGLCAPRPIAWVTSHDKDGKLNAAPFSAYNYLCIDPPVIGIGIAPRPESGFVLKDTAHNIRLTGEFVVNVVTEDLLQPMNLCAIDFPAGVDELKQAGLTTTPSTKISVPRIAQAHAALECVEHQTIMIGKSSIVLGKVVSMFVEDRYIDPAGPYVKAEELHAIGRMNGLGAYVRTRDAFLHQPRFKYADWVRDHDVK